MNPQAQRTQKLMLEAAGELLAEFGPEGVTHLEIARRSGVARATVYRHWPDRAAILLDLLRSKAAVELTPPPTDTTIIGQVTAVLRAFAGALNGEGGKTLAAMIGLAEWDADVFTALERMREFGPSFLRTVVAAGVENGSLRPATDPELVADMLIGPLYFRRLLYHDRIEDAYVDTLIEQVVAPLVQR